MKFEEQSLQTLRDLAKSKKGHPGVKGFSTMKKGDLVATLKKHFKIKGGALEEKSSRKQCIEGLSTRKVSFDGLEESYDRGIGAHKSNPASVRNTKGEKNKPGPKMPKEQWACARAKKLSEKGSSAGYDEDLVKGGAVAEKKSAIKRIVAAIDRIHAKIGKSKGGQISEKVKDMAKNIDVAGTGVKDGEDDIDFDDIKWGKFTDQLDRYNSQNKKNLDLCQFADLILKDQKKFSTTTQRRARFYKNVLAKKKCS